MSFDTRKMAVPEKDTRGENNIGSIYIGFWVKKRLYPGKISV